MKTNAAIRLYHIFLFLALPVISPVYGQLPQDLPYDTGPLTLDNPVKVLYYVVLPILAIIIVITYRRRKRSKNKKEKENL